MEITTVKKKFEYFFASAKESNHAGSTAKKIIKKAPIEQGAHFY